MEVDSEDMQKLEQMQEFFEDYDKSQHHALYGKIKILQVPGTDVHLRSWLISGATRTGKSVCLHRVAWEYSRLGFRIVYFDWPTSEGSNVNEAAFPTLPMTARHPLFKKTKEVHGEPVTVPVKVFRPYLFAHGFPVGLGVPNLKFPVPANVEPYTLSLSSLMGADWAALLGVLSRTSRNLLATAIRGMGPESGLQDLILEVERLGVEKHSSFVPEIPRLPRDTPGLRISTRSFDKKSVPGLLSRLESLASSGLILPETVAGTRVATNLDVGEVVRQNPWVAFNFSPSIPTEWVLGLTRFLVHRILRLDLPVVLVFQELSLFAPRQVPERQEWFVEPTRDLLRVLGTAFAKQRKLLLADCQRPEQIDKTLLDSFRYRAIFNRERQALETDIRYSGVVNAEELIANLRLLRDESGHKGYHVFIPPASAGSICRGDSIPPYRTHQTGEPDFDDVYLMEKGPRAEVKDLEPIHRYVTGIIYAVHSRIAQRQKAELVVEEVGEQRKFSHAYLLMVTETLQLGNGQDPTQIRVLQKDYVEHLKKRFAVSKPTAISYVQKLAADNAVFVDRTQPRRTLLLFNIERLKHILGSAKVEETEVSGRAASSPGNAERELAGHD